MPSARPDPSPRIFSTAFAAVYPLYVQKAERKGRTQAEVDAIIEWLTGYRGAALRQALDRKVDFATFFAKAPRMNPAGRAHHRRGVWGSRRGGRGPADAQHPLPRQADR
jgi:hypothetical protein